MNNDAEIYLYKMITDNGGAPCISAGLLSLAICKPKIRRTARPGSLIFGFGAKHYGERLIYIAEVTAKPPVWIDLAPLLGPIGAHRIRTLDKAAFEGFRPYNLGGHKGQRRIDVSSIECCVSRLQELSVGRGLIHHVKKQDRG